MTIIHVPRPSKTALNPDRPVSSLLLAQIQHLQHAERRLPLRYRTKIYTHAIRTEGEASRYIREVTEAIHQAHADAAVKRAKSAYVLKSRPKAKVKNSKDRNKRQRRFS
jgi:hypothetical protein